MCIVVPASRIASAAAVLSGRYGEVSRYARQRGVCRQWVYREADWVLDRLGDRAQQQRDALRQRVRQLEERNALLQRQLAQAVVLDKDKQAECAAVGQARGISLPDVHALLQVLRPGGIAAVSTLGRWTQAAAQQAGPLLAVFDEHTRPRVRQATADAIYVRAPALMVVEPDSLCWLTGRLTDTVSGDAWAEEFRQLPALEQVTRAAGSGLHKGVALHNAQRQAQGLPPLADPLDHWHCLRAGGGWRGRLEEPARVALAKAEAVEATEARNGWRGQKQSGSPKRCRAAWRKAERALDAWQEAERHWQAVTDALPLCTPEGELNTRARAEAQRAGALAHLPEPTFAKAQRLLGQPETFPYLDEVHRRWRRCRCLPRWWRRRYTGGLAPPAGGVVRAGPAWGGVAGPAVGVRGGVGQGRAGGGTGGGGGAAYPAPHLAGQQPGGVYQPCSADAAGAAPQAESGAARFEAAVLELPHVPYGAAARHVAVRALGGAVAERAVLVGPAQNDT